MTASMAGSVGLTGFSWQGPAPGQIGYDDVMLPLEIQDHAEAQPRCDAPIAVRAAWLLRKASLLDRAASADGTVSHVSTADASAKGRADSKYRSRLMNEARRARAAALEMQRRVVADLLTRSKPSQQARIGFVISSRSDTAAEAGPGTGRHRHLQIAACCEQHANNRPSNKAPSNP